MRGKEALVTPTSKTFLRIGGGLGKNDLQASSSREMVLGNMTQPHLFTAFTVSDRERTNTSGR